MLVRGGSWSNGTSWYCAGINAGKPPCAFFVLVGERAFDDQWRGGVGPSQLPSIPHDMSRVVKSQAL